MKKFVVLSLALVAMTIGGFSLKAIADNSAKSAACCVDNAACCPGACCE